MAKAAVRRKGNSGSHANAYTDESPSWQISGETFESLLALYQREQDAYDHGLG